jgi:hypothetical protein
VRLRDDHYRKLKRMNCICFVYVNHLAEVCIRKMDQEPPTGGVIFATTQWNDNSPLDEQGFPLFQGVRGVCAKLVMNPTPSSPSSTDAVLQGLHKTFAGALSFVSGA